MDSTPTPSDVFDGAFIHKTILFYILIHNNIEKFPKRDRYTIGKRLEENILETIELTLLAKSKNQASCLLILNKIDTKLKFIKILIRIGHNIKAIDQNKFIYLQEQTIELGKILGGWIKNTKQNPLK